MLEWTDNPMISQIRSIGPFIEIDIDGKVIARFKASAVVAMASAGRDDQETTTIFLAGDVTGFTYTVPLKHALSVWGNSDP